MSKFSDFTSKVEAVFEKVNWKTVGMVLSGVGLGISLLTGFAKDQQNDKVIRETARKTAIDELQKYLNDSTKNNNHHEGG